jgi:hypothetical protein
MADFIILLWWYLALGLSDLRQPQPTTTDITKKNQVKCKYFDLLNKQIGNGFICNIPKKIIKSWTYNMRNYSFSFLFGRFDDFMMSSLFGFPLHTTPPKSNSLVFLKKFYFIYFILYLQLKWFQRTIFGQLLFLMDELDGIILKK